MDCRIFQELLPRYLSGDLTPDAFDRMVTHEAECTACREQAAALMSAPGATWNPEQSGRAGSTDAEWMKATLARTVGADCDYIRLRLAEALDEALDADTARLCDEHLAGCGACRALAEVLRELPALYAELPRLRADHAFAGEIVARTLPPRLDWREVLRALVRRPEALWEGAMVCALLAVPLAGPSMSTWIASVRSAGGQVERTEVSESLAALGSPVTAAGAWIGATISDGQQSMVLGLSRMRARVEQSIHAEINERAASDPRVAMVVPLLEDVLGRIGLAERDLPTQVETGSPERPGDSPSEAPTAPSDDAVSPGPNQREGSPDAMH